MRTIFILICLTLVFAHRPIIGGGDHDKRPHGPIIGGGDHDDWQKNRNESIIGGGDHDKRPHGPIIGGDDHDDWQKHRNETIIGGGEHDKRPHGPIIGGDDHDIIAYKTISLRKNLNTKSLEELKNYALKVEEWKRNEKGERLMGGIHDYIDKIGKDEIIDYIVDSGLKYKELLEEETFQSVVSPTLKSEDHHIIGGDDHDKIAYQIVTLTNSLNTKSLEELKSYAIKVEEWRRNEKGEKLLGGIHDYIDSIGKDEIITYIIQSGMKYKELLEEKTFQSVVSPTLKSEKDHIYGGDDHDEIAYKIVTLTNFLNSKSIEEVKNYALKVEEWRRNEKGEKLLGGIHDYIDSVGKDKIISYILESGMKYKELLEEEKFLTVIAPAVKSEENHQQAGGLSDFVYRLDRDTLVSFAYSAEKYHMEKSGSHIRGGLHDYIFKMSNIEIAEYILQKAENYPELDSYSFLHKLAEQYGFSKSA